MRMIHWSWGPRDMDGGDGGDGGEVGWWDGGMVKWSSGEVGRRWGMRGGWLVSSGRVEGERVESQESRRGRVTESSNVRVRSGRLRAQGGMASRWTKNRHWLGIRMSYGCGSLDLPSPSSDAISTHD